jgi:hypothetical protein
MEDFMKKYLLFIILGLSLSSINLYYDCEVIGIEYNERQQLSSPTAIYTDLLFEITTANLGSFEIQDEV